MLLLGVSSTCAAVCDVATESSTRILAIGNDASVLEVPPDEWVAIEEDGRSLVIDAVADERYDLGLPPRFGRTLLRSRSPSVVRIRPDGATGVKGHARVSTSCAAAIPDAERAWWREAATLAQAAGAPMAVNDVDAFARRTSALSASAFDPASRALARHIAAQGTMQARQYVRSASEFERAVEAWTLAGDRARASAARVGQAESLVASGRYDAALALVHSTSSRPAATYYDVRLQNSRCLSLHYLHRLAEAETCYDGLANALRRIDEPTERANALRNRADLLFAIGDLDEADAVALDAHATAVGPYGPMIRGRAQLTRANVAVARGDMRAAIASTATALSDFEDAGARAWQGDAKLKAARIFAELGARDDAYLAVRDALLDYSRDEPALVASALRVYAEIEIDNGRHAQAQFGAAAAARIYSSLKMPLELERARLSIGRAALLAGDLDEAERIRSETTISPSNAIANALFNAELDGRRGRTKSAMRRLAGLRGVTMGFSEAVDLARIDADVRHREGDIEGANAVLQVALDRITSVAHGGDNVLLRRMLLHKAMLLRRAGIGFLLEPGTSSARDVEAAWRWVAPVASSARDGIVPAAEADAGADQRAFDRAVARDILGPAPASTDAARGNARKELLSLLGARSGAARSDPRADRVTLAEAERLLRDGDVLLALLDGESRWAIVLVGKGGATIHPLRSAGHVVRESIGRLLALAGSSVTSVAEVDRSARQLSEQLLGAIPSSPPPRRLFVLAGSDLDDVPWSLLHWPGNDEPLVSTTRVALLRYGSPQQSSSTAARTPDVLVFSPPRTSASPGLPVLEHAAAETALVRTSLADRNLPVEDASPVPARFLAALDRRSAWIHVAAHGIVRPNRIGYAGIWFGEIEGAESVSPPFLSWVDILARGVKADLVVLNACDLGQGNSGGTLGFAGAVSEAGAHQVVASLWPMSDAAAPIWVPAFYAALAADSTRDASAAVRAAQMQLRKTRMFRHPFYWSGIETFVRASGPAAPEPTFEPKHSRPDA